MAGTPTKRLFGNIKAAKSANLEIHLSGYLTRQIKNIYDFF